MAHASRTSWRWHIRLAGGVVLLLALCESRLAVGVVLLLVLMIGLAYPTLASADDCDDDNELVTSGPNVCVATANLPAYPNATCLMHEIELEAGRIKTENT
jgi:hypothetical protein